MRIYFEIKITQEFRNKWRTNHRNSQEHSSDGNQVKSPNFVETFKSKKSGNKEDRFGFSGLCLLNNAACVLRILLYFVFIFFSIGVVATIFPIHPCVMALFVFFIYWILIEIGKIVLLKSIQKLIIKIQKWNLKIAKNTDYKTNKITKNTK